MVGCRNVKHMEEDIDVAHMFDPDPEESTNGSLALLVNEEDWSEVAAAFRISSDDGDGNVMPWGDGGETVEL